MKRLKKGPELKLPELKVPAFASDLYWDLRDRHMLPLVALAIVAIIAVPFLLGGGSEEEPVLPATIGALEEGAKASSLTVVEAKPGLRDYRKRLRGRTATDPFEQRYTAPTLAGTKLGGGEGGSGDSSTTTSVSKTTTKTTKTTGGKTTTTVKTETDDSKTTTGGDGSSGSGGAEPEIALFSFAIKVRTTRISGDSADGKNKSKPNVRDHVLPPAPLPSAKKAVVTYMGISPKTKKPLLLVSDEVSAVFGDGKCLSGDQSCQLIEVEPGFPETFVYGPNSVRYKVEVVKVEPVIAGKY